MRREVEGVGLHRRQTVARGSGKRSRTWPSPWGRGRDESSPSLKKRSMSVRDAWGRGDVRSDLSVTVGNLCWKTAHSESRHVIITTKKPPYMKLHSAAGKVSVRTRGKREGIPFRLAARPGTPSEKKSVRNQRRNKVGGSLFTFPWDVTGDLGQHQVSSIRDMLPTAQTFLSCNSQMLFGIPASIPFATC